MPPTPLHDQTQGPCSFPGADALLCPSAMALIPVLPHPLQAGPRWLPARAAGQVPSLQGKQAAALPRTAVAGAWARLVSPGLAWAQPTATGVHSSPPGSVHPLTRAWVVGKGCRSRGFGSLGIRSSGSTLTCERQAVRHNQAAPRPPSAPLAPVLVSCMHGLYRPAAPGQAPAGKPRLGALSQRGNHRTALL